MHQIHPNSSLVPILKRIVAGDFNFHLFRNDIGVDENTVLEDFEEVLDTTGYAPIAVMGDDWIFEGVNEERGYLLAPPIEYTQVGAIGDVAYGYYVTNTENEILLWCARFDGAPVPFDIGDTITVWPILGDKSRFVD